MASNSKLKLKLMIDTKSRKVLFAEAGKDVVDFLFRLLALPIGSIIKLITKESMAGCLGTMYGSLEQLDNTYLLSTRSKSQLLNPTTSTAASTNFLLLSVSTNAPVDKINKYYRCLVSGSIYQSEFHNYVTDAYGTACPACQNPMIVQVQLIAKKEEKSKKGFVKGVVTYIVMDDLSVVPMSTISSITLLSRFRIKDLSTLEEKIVSLSHQEVFLDLYILEE